MTNSILETGIRLVRNVDRYNFGWASIRELSGHLEKRRIISREKAADSRVVFFIDQFFQGRDSIIANGGIKPDDCVIFVPTSEEPTTKMIDQLTGNLRDFGCESPCAVVGIGGGITLDTAKAVSNLLTNGGLASDYQGWDLVKVPGIYKIGIPTISGTGAEATRTCVMTNPVSGLKLGMNSDYTVFDQIILDPELTGTVPRNQYFYTGMDAYIHCFESLSGSYRNAIGDAFSRETMNLCRQVFNEGDMMSAINRERLMVASYLGGCAIASSYVGLVHPFSAGLSVVLGTHHCIGNCIAIRAMDEFYPHACTEFWRMAELQKIEVPSGLCNNLSDQQYMDLYNATVIHQKPLTNALGEDFKKVLTVDKVIEMFKKM